MRPPDTQRNGQSTKESASVGSAQRIVRNKESGPASGGGANKACDTREGEDASCIVLRNTWLQVRLLGLLANIQSNQPFSR